LGVKSKISCWKGEFGRDYVMRNSRNSDETDNFSINAFGISRTDLLKTALSYAQPESIIEIGCNIGQNFPLLRALSPSLHITGVEINFEAAHIARNKYPQTDVVQAVGFDLPFSSASVDFIFTAGVLIHIHPDDLDLIINEMWRVSGKYIFGMEYHSEGLEHVVYRGHEGLLWKQDFEEVFRNRCQNLRTVFSDIYEYSETIFGRKGLYYKVYLMEKT